MRLGQLARNLGITAATIVKEIKEATGEKIDSSLNTKLSDEQVAILSKKFKVNANTEIETVTKSLNENELSSLKTEKQVVLTEEAQLELAKKQAETLEREKIKLQGPKVLDKIELSESVLKDFEEKAKKKKISPKHLQQKERQENKTKKVKIKASDFELSSVEAHLKKKQEQERRKQEIEKRKKQKQEEKLKAQRKQNYLKQVNLEKPKKKKKPFKVEEKPVYVQKQLEKQKPKPPKKTFWQKLFGIFGK